MKISRLRSLAMWKEGMQRLGDVLKHFEREGKVLMSRLKKTWNVALRKDHQNKGLDKEVALKSTSY